MSIKFYRFLILIFYPIIYIFLCIRKFNKKEDKYRFKERFGKTELKRPDGNIIWFNAVSVGEINSAWTIIKKINENLNNNILITTTSVTSSDNVINKIKMLPNPNKVIHQFTPIDVTFCIKRFLKKWRPNLLINVESEFWPNLFTITKKYCNIIVLNGKMSKKSFRFWYKNKKLKESIFDSIDICLAQSRNDYKRFINLGVQNVQFIGNIKFFTEKCDIDNDLYRNLIEKVKNRKTWLVNCTHKGEEEIIIESHKILKEKYKDIITMLIIRHPNRINEVCNIMEKYNIKYKIYTSNEDIEDNTEFYIYDKFGKLGTFFEINDIVLIAGSLIKNIGGHTPAEAIKHNCCIITGPYLENNYNLFKDLLNDNACIILNDNKPKTIASTLIELFENNEYRKKIINNSYKKSVNNNIMFDEIIRIIDSYLN